MKNLINQLLALFFLASANGLYAGAVAPSISADKVLEEWQILGVKKVNYGLDRDEIYVTSRDGLFRKVKLKVRNAPLNMHKMVIHFGNGSTQSVFIRKNLNKGAVSRTIDLEGGKRIIKKVVLWYDTKNIAARKAKLELWGMH